MFLTKLTQKTSNVKVAVTKVFNRFDKDKSGGLDLEEFSEAVKSLLVGLRMPISSPSAKCTTWMVAAP